MGEDPNFRHNAQGAQDADDARDAQDAHDRHPRRVADALLRAAAAALPAAPNPYLVFHLPDHLADAGTWDELGAMPELLDRLDPTSLATAALGSALDPDGGLPADVVAVLAAANYLDEVPVRDRAFARQAMRRRFDGDTPTHARRPDPIGAGGGWEVGWSRVRPATVHRTLTELSGSISALTAFTLRDGSPTLAGMNASGTVLLWDTNSGRIIGQAPGGNGLAHALAALSLPDGPVVLALVGGDGRVCLWDPRSAGRLAAPGLDRESDVRHLASVPLPDGTTLLAVTDHRERVRLWHPGTGDLLDIEVTSRLPPAGTLVTVPLTQIVTCLVVVTPDGQVRRPIPDARTERSIDPAVTTAVLPLPNGQCTVATAGLRGVVRLHNPFRGLGGTLYRPARDGVSVLTTLPIAGRPPLLATGHRNGAVRLLDPIVDGSFLRRMTGHTEAVTAMAAIPQPPGRPALIATAADDGTVRLWYPELRRSSASEPLPLRAPAISYPTTAMTAAIDRDGNTQLVTTDSSGEIRIFEPETGRDPEPLRRDPEPLRGDRPMWRRSDLIPTLIPRSARRRLLSGITPNLAVCLQDPRVGLSDRSPDHRHPFTRDALPWDDEWSRDTFACAATLPWDAERSVLAIAEVSGMVSLWDLDPPGVPDVSFDSGRRHIHGLLPVPYPGGPARLVIAGRETADLTLWDPHSDSAWTHSLPDGLPATNLTAVPIPGGRTWVAVTGIDHVVRLWNPADGRTIPRRLDAHARTAVAAVEVLPAPDGNTLLAVGDSAGRVRLWDPTTGEVVHVLAVGVEVRALAAVGSSLAIGGPAGLWFARRTGVVASRA
ncbi:WD40 repeat domain-containing protein [Embleya sp. NPDC050493]|uniref:WD40 repeat domain-containing protein n=1 Tax=Embleya sp. NPDC050493 TaxID=3363989 RepID=UPI0037AFCA55